VSLTFYFQSTWRIVAFMKFIKIFPFFLSVILSHDVFAQAVTMGSNLTSVPNISIDCAVQPVIESQFFNFVPSASGTADCTWRQAGVFGVISGDSRFSSVPGDGVITSVSVRSGPNPAPLKFSILRQLTTPGFGAEGQCCFFVGESAEVQPAPNTVTTFPVNIPVVRNVLDGIYAIDLFAVSARSGAGTLPLFSTTGGVSNAFQLTEQGSVNAGFFYPRVGADPNDSGGGRRETGMPGIELLVQWTWVPSGGGQIGGNVGASVEARSAIIRRAKAEINVVCGGDAACKGALELVNGVPAAVVARVNARKSAIVSFGKADYSIKGGKSKLIKVTLNKKGKAAVKSGNFQAYLRIKPKSGSSQTIDMLLVPS
jgi:hypothetical protein